jgi:chromosome partitioning protein
MRGVRKLLEDRGFIYPEQNISLQMVKGGTGKTSSTYSLSIRLAHYGARVLVIDFDMQSNTTRAFNIEARHKPVWLNIFRDNVAAQEAVVRIYENLHVIPSSLNNSRLDVELLQSSYNMTDSIRALLSPIRPNYDFIIMDCPTAINKITATVTCASDLILIPVNPETFAMDGVDYTVSEIKKLKKEFGLKCDYKIVWNKYDARERLGPICMHDLASREDLANHVLPVVCRVDTSIKNAIFDSKNIFELPRKSPLREDFDHFAREILGINTWKNKKSD